MPAGDSRAVICLPDFLIIGGMRCGSTTLANLLKTHSSIFLPESKELHYFDQRNPHIKNIDQYSQAFSKSTNTQLIGEATPDYLSTRGCAEKIFSVLPNANLIIILRDPVQRAWSHYRFSVSMGREIEPFKNALKLEDERLAHPIHEHDIYFSYKQRSRYIEHILNFTKNFDRSQLHILFLEELINNPDKIVNKLFEFLQIKSEKYWQSALRITNQASLVNIENIDNLESKKRRNMFVNRVSAKILNSRYLKFPPQQWRDVLYRKIETAVAPQDAPDQDDLMKLKGYFKHYNQQLKEFINRELPW